MDGWQRLMDWFNVPFTSTVVSFRLDPLLAAYFAAACALLLVLYLVAQLGVKLLSVFLASKGRDFVSVASAAQLELRAQLQDKFPPAHHSWSKGLPSQASPIACAFCYVSVSRDGQFCTVCGTVVHQGCSRLMHSNCKPIALPPFTQPTHDWRPVGCTLHAAEAAAQLLSSPAAHSLDDDLEEHLLDTDQLPHCCLYCAEPCEVGLIAVEPVWICSCCHSLAHVQCYVHRHPLLFTAHTKARLQGQLSSFDSPDIPGSGPTDTSGSQQHTPDQQQHIGLPPVDASLSGAGARPVPRSPAAGPSPGEVKISKAGGHMGSKSRAARASADGLSRRKIRSSSGALSELGVHAHAHTHTDAAGRQQAGQNMVRRKSSSGLSGLFTGWTGTGTGSGVLGLGHVNGGRMTGRLGSDFDRSIRATSETGAAAGSLPPHAGGVMSTAPGTPCTPHSPSDPGTHPFGSDVEVCRWGPMSRYVLPPTCVRVLTPPSPLGKVQGDGGGQGKAGASKGHAQQGLVSAAAAAAVKWRRKNRAGQGSNSGAGSGAGNGSATSHHNGGTAQPVAVSAVSHSHVDAGVLGSPGGAGGGAGGVHQDVTPVAGSSGSRLQGAAGGSSGSAGRSRRPWWKRVSEHDRWSPYQLSEVGLSSCRPLLVFVNLKSGPQLGRTLHLQLLQLLHPLQVVELPREDPLIALRFFAPAPHVRVLVMGGDGTVGWILQVLDTLTAELGPTWTPPPVAVLPMGTGNDLARCLGWGGGSSARLSQGLVSCLLEVAGGGQAHLVPLDRWDVAIRPPVRPTPNRPIGSIKRLLGTRRRSETVITNEVLTHKTLNNYLGIGIDAKVALEFHQTRSAHPYWFQSQLGNKVWYTGLGAPDLLRRSCADLHKKLTLECNGVRVPIPSDAQGLIIININCHMGGVYLWEQGLPAPAIPADAGADPDTRLTALELTRPRRMTIADGLIEVVAIGGVAHMGRLAVGLARAQRLCQCSSLSIITHKELPMQVDGEPWLQDPCRLNIGFKNQALMLRRVRGGPAQRVVAAVNDALEVSCASGLISSVQKAAVSKEVGRRLQAALA